MIYPRGSWKNRGGSWPGDRGSATDLGDHLELDAGTDDP